MSTICEFKKGLYIYISNNNKDKDKMESLFQTTEQKKWVNDLRSLFVDAKGKELEILTEIFYVDLLCMIKKQQNIKGEELKNATDKIFKQILFSKF